MLAAAVGGCAHIPSSVLRGALARATLVKDHDAIRLGVMKAPENKHCRGECCVSDNGATEHVDFCCCLQVAGNPPVLWV